MKKSDLKKLIKPIVKECIAEMLLEEGMLSSLISEVLQGTGATITEAKLPRQRSLMIACKLTPMRQNSR